MNEQTQAATNHAASINGKTPCLWNPQTASVCCLLLTPMFGIILHALNWRELGKPEKARTAFIWAGGFLVFVFFAMIFSIVGWSIPLLLAWYFISGRQQEKYVKETFGNSYERKGWGLPIVCGIGGIVALIIVLTGIYYILSAVGVHIPE